MIKGLHPKTFSVSIMLVLFLVASVFGSEGTLLCFDKDGHVAIEFVDACNGAGLGSQFKEMENDACGPCKDVQFLSSPAHTNKASHYTQMLSLISSSPVLSSLYQEEYSNKSVVLPVSSHYKTLASLNSVILLI
jgi:hypothetical protein